MLTGCIWAIAVWTKYFPFREQGLWKWQCRLSRHNVDKELGTIELQSHVQSMRKSKFYKQRIHYKVGRHHVRPDLFCFFPSLLLAKCPELCKPGILKNPWTIRSFTLLQIERQAVLGLKTHKIGHFFGVGSEHLNRHIWHIIVFFSGGKDTLIALSS